MKAGHLFFHLRSAFVFFLCVVFAGCVSNTDSFNRISVGMTKDEVVSTIGAPTSTRATGKLEVLVYNLAPSGVKWTVVPAEKATFPEYFVRLIDGRVESFGKMGDFDSTKNPAIDINTKSKVDATVTQSGTGNKIDLESELRRLDRLRKDGLITDADYDAQKKKLLEMSLEGK